MDVEITARDDERVADVLPVLRRALAVPVAGLWGGSALLDDQLPLTSPALRHGAVLGLGRPAPATSPGTSPLELRVMGGPDAGRDFPLAGGRLVLGRGQECDVRIADPDISRRHLEIRLGEGAVEVRDVGSTNGSTLDGEPLDERFRPWPADARVHLGSTALAVTGSAGPPAVLEPAVGGRTMVRPPHRLHVPRAESEIALPAPPADAPRRRLAWVAVLLPAIGGGLLAWLLRTPTFLFFALLSPLMALGSWASDRWSGRRSSRRERAAYRVELATALGALDVAVRADVRAAEQEHPDPATIAAAVRKRTADVWSRGPAGASRLVVRIGTGPGPSQVTRVDGAGSRHREPADHLPVTVDLADTGGLAVVGPRRHALGTLRAVLVQLTALQPPDGLVLVLLTRLDRVPDWTWARWLPHLPAGAVHVVADAGATKDGGEKPLPAGLAALLRDRPGADTGRVVVVVDCRLDPRTADALVAARSAGVVLLTTAERTGELPVAVDATVTSSSETGSTAVLARDRCADRPAVRVDRLPTDLSEDVARHLADLVPAGTTATLPQQVRLLDLPGGALRLDEEGGTTGRWPGERDPLRACLGRSADGPVEIDLCRDGPHALVAGTTGSGKSELLQALIAGLALNHPPERCSFLLVDYKGGAAFAEAARLPHTVGLLTDLEGSTTARALRSLTAELSRREALLAEHGVPDLAALPESVHLARLVIVVDEFATLVEELPDFVPGLVGIAQRGRSLGIHLVLATQRPGGVVSPEIRANCSLRLCLRTTDEADSRDILGSPAAAHLPAHVPGRAFVRTGNGEPRVFQVARIAVPAPPPDAGIEARRWSWPAPRPSACPAPAPGPTDLSRLAEVLSGLAAQRGVPLPHRPWQPPLPDRLLAQELDPYLAADREDRADSALPIGLVDRPDLQAREPLVLDLAEGGGVLAVGGPRSGRTTLLRTLLRAATARLGPDRLHVHVLEPAGGALTAEAAALPHTGTAVSGPDALRTVRLLDRLGREVDERRSGPSGRTEPLVLLLVDGVEAVSALLDEAEPGRGSDVLLRLVRDGAAVGVTCVLTADRATPGGRLSSAARLRLLLPLPDRADYALAGVPARAVATHRPPGRALVGEDARECQLALPGTSSPRTTEGSGAAAAPPVRIVELPADPVLPAHDAVGWQLTIGPGGDDGTPLTVDLLRSGGLLVVGPPGSGRSTALDCFARRLTAAGALVARLGAAPGSSSTDAASVVLDPADPTALRAWTETLDGLPGVLLADDLGAAAEYSGLAALQPTGARSRIVLLAAGSAGQVTTHYQGPVAALRRARTGLLLCPGPADAEALGIRLPRLRLPVRPGSGWLVRDGVAQRVQVARVPGGAGRGPAG